MAVNTTYTCDMCGKRSKNRMVEFWTLPNGNKKWEDVDFPNLHFCDDCVDQLYSLVGPKPKKEQE